MRKSIPCLAAAVLSLLAGSAAVHGRQAYGAVDIEDLARLLMLEDRREFAEAELARIAGSAHPDVRRRAVLAIGRIRDERGRALLANAREDADTAVVATVAFSTGQLRDSSAVPWLASMLHATSAPTVAREAAIALGRIRSPDAQAALLRFLADAPATPAMAGAVGEALLSLGRFTARAELEPVLRWTTSRDPELRWRAAWSLYRPRDPAAVRHLLGMSEDPSAEVRFWAMRGLAPLLADSAGIDRAVTSARLRAALDDPDRRVRTEALRALVAYDDDASFARVLAAVDDDDSWLAVSAIEALARFADRADAVVPRLLGVAAAGKPRELRMVALTQLVALAPDEALELAAELVRDSSVVVRTAAAQAMQRLGDAGRARLDELRADPATRVLLPAPGGGGGGGGRVAQEAAAQRTLDDYRAIVERWIVPVHEGAPLPRAIWETSRGTIELELFAADAPLAMEHFVRVIESGDIVGTEFGRVVPNFVAQQRPIRTDIVLRDEVNRHGLTRANLSWASAGLDTGRPGYTLGNTPQPHNEGDFTALGRVVRGMDVVDRMRLGDRITAARMVR